MTESEAIGYMENEIRCIQRSNYCDRDCKNCNLVKDDEPLIESYGIAINALEKIQQYRALGTVEELKAKTDELERWHTDHTVEEIKNVFANTSTLICHNCDHKDEYIIELESEVEELREEKEKQIPKKPIINHINTSEYATEIEYTCSVCGANFVELTPCQEWCPYCGNKIDWSDEE